jgi:hypothetical protein
MTRNPEVLGSHVELVVDCLLMQAFLLGITQLTRGPSAKKRRDVLSRRSAFLTRCRLLGSYRALETEGGPHLHIAVDRLNEGLDVAVTERKGLEAARIIRVTGQVIRTNRA